MMKIFNLMLVLLFVSLIGCDDSLNGPVGSNLTYEPQVVAVGETVDFGTIGNDAIKIKLAGIVGNAYQLEHSDKNCDHCPIKANDERLELIMCGKYQVTFIANTLPNNNFTLQLHHYKNL